MNSRTDSPKNEQSQEQKYGFCPSKSRSTELRRFRPNRKICSLSDEEFERYWKSIEKNESWEVGEEDFIEKWIISGVHKKRGIIFEYLIQKPHECVWLKKDKAIALANVGRLHAIVIHVKNGTHYLRPEYGTKPFDAIV